MLRPNFPLFNTKERDPTPITDLSCLQPFSSKPSSLKTIKKNCLFIQKVSHLDYQLLKHAIYMITKQKPSYHDRCCCCYCYIQKKIT